eukprot:7377974-Prymnesium_polylepis.2
MGREQHELWAGSGQCDVTRVDAALCKHLVLPHGLHHGRALGFIEIQLPFLEPSVVVSQAVCSAAFTSSRV